MSPPRKRVDKARRPQKSKDKKPNSPRSEGEESHSSDSTYKASKETGSEDESQNEGPESEALKVSGLRIWEKKSPKEPRSALVPLRQLSPRTASGPKERPFPMPRCRPRFPCPAVAWCAARHAAPCRALTASSAGAFTPRRR